MKVEQSKHSMGQSGTSLMENLISLFVLSVGLLGFAGLQTSSVRNNNHAALYMTAVQQAHDIADRILSNPAAVYGFLPAGYANITPATIPVSPPNCTGSACTPSQIALLDEWEWNASIAANNTGLPAGGGYVTGTPLATASLSSTGVPRMRYLVTVRWDGNRTGATGLNCPPISDSDFRCVQLEVYP